MSENRNHNQKSYDTWSTFYDVYPNPTVAVDEMNFPRFWQQHQGLQVLEIGCGTGRHTVKLAGLQNQVTAVEPSAGMLAVAKTKLAGHNARFIEGDFLNLELPVAAFDVALEALVLEHISDLKAFFQKASACLKRSGDFYLSEIHPNRTSSGVFAHFKTPDQVEEIHLQSFLHLPDQIESAAAQAGFRLIQRQDILGDTALADLNPKWSRYLGQPMLQIWHLRRK